MRRWFNLGFKQERPREGEAGSEGLVPGPDSIFLGWGPLQSTQVARAVATETCIQVGSAGDVSRVEGMVFALLEHTIN